jgi:hypothetical protein
MFVPIGHGRISLRGYDQVGFVVLGDRGERFAQKFGVRVADHSDPFAPRCAFLSRRPVRASDETNGYDNEQCSFHRSFLSFVKANRAFKHDQTEKSRAAIRQKSEKIVKCRHGQTL